MSLKDSIHCALTSNTGMSDRELADAIIGKNAPPQAVNIAARALEKDRVLQRRLRDDGVIGNYLIKSGNKRRVMKARATRALPDVDALSEDAIKKILDEKLRAAGWHTQVAYGKRHGVDIHARRADENLYIEVKGPGSRPPMRVNYFLGILGEILQRMKDERGQYFICLPDLPQYRRLWSRFPRLAKRRLNLGMIFVKLTDQTTVLDTHGPNPLA